MNIFFKKCLIKMNYFVLTLLIIISVYFLIIINVYFFQSTLLYKPTENNYSNDKISVSVEKIKIPTTDDIEILSWYHDKNTKKNKTILFLHGNAGSLENRIHKINKFKDININFLIIAWRGFSGNEGKPNEKGLYDDASSAVKWLKSKGVFENDIIIYGESLGTGVAVEIAQFQSFGGIILESPFTSMIDVGKDKYPFLPVKIILKDRYESNKKIKNIKIPIMIMHGKLDNIVPFRMGEKMYQLASEPKYSYFSDYDNHMMEYNKKLLETLKSFILSLN